MGGIEVDPDTGAAATPCSPPGECSGGDARPNRLGGNSLSGPAGVRPPGRARRGRLRARPSRPGVRGGGRGGRWRSAAVQRHRPPGEPHTLHIRTAADDETTWSASSARTTRSRRPSTRSRSSVRTATSSPTVAAIVQPRLAPGHGHAQHAAGQRMRGQGRTGAHRKPRRAHPRRPPGRWTPAGATHAGGAAPATTR